MGTISTSFKVGGGELVMKKRGSGFSLVHYHSFVKGYSYPKLCAQRDARAEDFLISFIVGAETGFLCNVYISLGDEGL